MNPNYQAASALFDALAHHLPETNSRCEIVCFPPSCYLTMAGEKLAKTDISWGAQNCHQQEKGAFTGEISAQMVAEFGGSWVLLGHSERREYYSESDALVSEKLAAALAAGLRPVICVGEPEAVRVRGAQDEFVQKQ
ncbi:MAG: triose-phosphate isomerase family protein, partial [Candidatus Puniceispirillaceae bacterium]